PPLASPPSLHDALPIFAANDTARTAQASGSHRAPATKSRAGGSGEQAEAGTTTRSAKPPGRCAPISARSRQRFSRPDRQGSQRRSEEHTSELQSRENLV